MKQLISRMYSEEIITIRHHNINKKHTLRFISSRVFTGKQENGSSESDYENRNKITDRSWNSESS